MRVWGGILFLFSNHGLEVTCQFKPFFKAFASDSRTVGQSGTFRKVPHWHQKISRPNEFNKLSLGSIWHSDSVCQSTTGPSTCQVEDRKAHKCFPGSEKKKEVIFQIWGWALVVFTREMQPRLVFAAGAESIALRGMLVKHSAHWRHQRFADNWWQRANLWT